MRISLQTLSVRLFFIAYWALFLLLCVWQSMPEHAWRAACAIVGAMGVISAFLCLQEMWTELNGTGSASSVPNQK